VKYAMSSLHWATRSPAKLELTWVRKPTMWLPGVSRTSAMATSGAL
jgi:hypothetical protein